MPAWWPGPCRPLTTWGNIVATGVKLPGASRLVLARKTEGIASPDQSTHARRSGGPRGKSDPLALALVVCTARVQCSRPKQRPRSASSPAARWGLDRWWSPLEHESRRAAPGSWIPDDRMLFCTGEARRDSCWMQKDEMNENCLLGSLRCHSMDCVAEASILVFICFIHRVR
jgi:hypothetical protein